MQKKNYSAYLLSIAFGISIFLFFWKYFPYHLHYREQFQLFLFTKAYFLETCLRPGGFSDYVGRFLTQFYISSLLGAITVSCLLVSIQQLVYAISRKFGKHQTGLFLSFLPALFYWYLFCDENSQTGGIVALLFALIFAWITTMIKSNPVRRTCLLLIIPVLYWLAGGVAILAAILLLLYEWRIIKSRGKSFLLLSVAAISFVVAAPFAAKYFLMQYPLGRFWWGVDYVHFTNYPPYLITFLWGLIVLIMVIIPYVPEIKRIRKPVFSAIRLAALLLVSYLLIIKVAYPFHASKEELMAYDYHCRMKNWNRIIEMANRKAPTVPMTVCCLNLALYKTGQLPEKMFHYFQNGPEGLLPTFQRDFMIPSVAGEPYYYLGFVNTAQRFAFEAMESLPDYQKSVRSIKRLAETNLINGHYEVASKYLYFLENTLFYKAWAKETRACLSDEMKINAHPEWGEIRRFRTNEDFLFSEKEKDMMLGIYFRQHRDNRMAYEYLMAYALLTKDIKNVPEYFRLKKDFSYPSIPKSYQEALVYIWGLGNNNIDSIPVPVSNSVKQEVAAYANIYTTLQSPEPVLKKQFANTYWYYLHFKNYNRANTERPYQY